MCYIYAPLRQTLRGVFFALDSARRDNARLFLPIESILCRL